eukprot:754504-Hanusia_phi.AAC.1
MMIGRPGQGPAYCSGSTLHARTQVSHVELRCRSSDTTVPGRCDRGTKSCAATRLVLLQPGTPGLR